LVALIEREKRPGVVNHVHGNAEHELEALMTAVPIGHDFGGGRVKADEQISTATIIVHGSTRLRQLRAVAFEQRLQCFQVQRLRL
jgi:hypothetical protein